MSAASWRVALPERIRAWDQRVEDEGAPDEDARRPFDGGMMLAAATVLERWESGDLAEAVRMLAETAEEVIDDGSEQSAWEAQQEARNVQ